MPCRASEGEADARRGERVSYAKTAFVFMRTPDGEANIELIKFRNPPDENGIQKPFANTLGIRHIAFVVEDIEAVVAKLRKNGAEIFNGVQQYQDSYKLGDYPSITGIERR